MPERTIELMDVEKQYGDIVAVQRTSLSVNSGEVVVLCGRSGSGKSTLLRCINGLEAIDNGEIRFAGNSVDMSRTGLRQLRERIGMVFQSFNLFPHLTVRQNLVLAPIKVLGLSRMEADKRALALLARVGIQDKKDAYPGDLSGGQQQRVAIARALCMEPEVLLFDEPTSALDPEMIGEVLAVMRDLAVSGTTMVIVTHEMNFAREVADRIAFMEDGEIVEHSSCDEFFRNLHGSRAKSFVNMVRDTSDESEVTRARSTPDGP